jgi:hypothetical protein
MNFPHDSVAATVRLRLRFLVTLTKAALSKFSDCFETIVIMGVQVQNIGNTIGSKHR